MSLICLNILLFRYVSSDWCSQERANTSEYIEISNVNKQKIKNDVNVILTPQRPFNDYDFKIRNLSNFSENRKLISEKLRKIILARNEEVK